MTATEAFQQLTDSLAPTIASVSSIEGVVVVLLITWLVFGVVKKAARTVWSASACILAVQAIYLLTSAGVVPYTDLFSHDVLAAVAQLFVGTPICDGIMWVDAHLTAAFGSVFGG